MNAGWTWRRVGALLVALAALGAGPAQAQLSAVQAEQLMRLSGQWVQLESMAAQMKDGLLQGLAAGDKPVPAEVQQKIRQAAESAFGIANVRGAAQRTIAENVRSEHVPELLRWYDSEVARRITQAEVDDSARPREELKLRTQTGIALVRAATPERQQLLLKLVEVTRAARAGADVVINMGVALPLSMSRFDPQAPKLSEAELRAALEDQRPQLTQAFETISLAGFAIMYQGVADEALAAYAQFMAGAAGEHYTDIGERAFEAALLAAIGALKP